MATSNYKKSRCRTKKKPIQQKKPMQKFTAEKWADKIALFIDNFGFLSGFFWHWTIALPTPTSHLAMLHSKIILSDPNRRVKVVLHRLFLILKPMQKMEYYKSGTHHQCENEKPEIVKCIVCQALGRETSLVPCGSICPSCGVPASKLELIWFLCCFSPYCGVFSLVFFL